MSDFTSNLRRSKSFRYSIARGLGGREGMGREGEDMSDATAGALAVVQGFSKVHTSARAALIHRKRKPTSWGVSPERNGGSPSAGL